jgi:redox-sensing transcriptional repressor
MLRLSRYHCFVGELLRASWAGRLRSRQMAEELGVAEETVRRDLSYVDIEGRPGAGYDPDALYLALEKYLGLSAAYPFVAVCSAQMLEALGSIFPAEDFGMHMVACFSADDNDAGRIVAGVEVRPFAELATAGPKLGATVALIACAPDAVNDAMDAVHAAGIGAVLMLTPVLRPHYPEGMQVTYFRSPCSLKSLASASPTAPAAPSCCSGGACEKA